MGTPSREVREPGGHERLAQRSDRRSGQPPGAARLVLERTAAAYRRPLLAGRRVSYHAGHHDAANLGRQRHGVLRQPIQVVHGAIDRIEDPPHRGAIRLADHAGFLAQDGVARPCRVQFRDHVPFDGMIGGRDDIGVGALRTDLCNRLIAEVTRELGAAPGDPYGQGQQLHRRWRFGHEGIVPNARYLVSVPSAPRVAGRSANTALQFTLPSAYRPVASSAQVARHGQAEHGPSHWRSRLLRRANAGSRGTVAAAHSLRPGRSLVTEARQSEPDVRTLTESLLTRAAESGGELSAATVAKAVEEAALTASQAKKVVQTLTEAGVLHVDGSGNLGRRKVAAA